MAITMQGPWTVQVKSKNAAFPQRFRIAGAASGNGTYDGLVTTPPVAVSGEQWTITIEHNPTGPTPWTASAMRITFPTTSGGQVRFDIQSNDTGGDLDYDDLILTCSMVASPSEYVVYGHVESYSGLCIFNPCFPFPWIVIDSPLHLLEVLKYPDLKRVLFDLYPDRVRPLIEKPGVVRPPRPEPDPAPFIPLIIPLGPAWTEQRFGLQLSPQRSAPPPAEPARPARRGRGGTAAQSAASETAEPAPLAISRPATRPEIGSAVLDRVAPYARSIGKIVDKLKVGCTTKDAAGILLRFLEYDRTADELAGGPYTGGGDRQVLGLAATDERGNYIFRFSQTLADLAEEFEDIIPGGPPVATQLRPDLLLQVMSAGPSAVLYESGLFVDVPNLKRIDLCLPESTLNPGPTSCQGGRAIQSIGNIFTISGVGNTLDVNGRITATFPSGPQITRGAWAGGLDLFACFLDLPQVEFYTIRFRRPGGTWSFVQELYKHIRIPDIAPGYTGTKVGPDLRNLAVGGGPKQIVPSYMNIEADSEWLATHRLRKVQLSSAYYENLLYGPLEFPRSVDFRIEGYDSGGNKVTGAEDTIRLLIDNRPVSGDIAEVSMGSVTPGECALFELTAPNAVITVRFKVNQPGGFCRSYSLAVTRGSNEGVPVSDTTPPPQPLTLNYDESTHGSFFFGTLNGVGPDPDGYVLAQLQPNGGAWLPVDKNFCAFEFSIAASPRTTNGYGVFGGYTLDKELVGISYSP